MMNFFGISLMEGNFWIHSLRGKLNERFCIRDIKPILLDVLRSTISSISWTSNNSKVSSMKKCPSVKNIVLKHKKEIMELADNCGTDIIIWFKERSSKNEQKCFALVHSDNVAKKKLLLILESYTKDLNHNDCILFYAMLHTNIKDQWYAHSYFIETEIQHGKDVLLLTSFRIRN